MKTCLVVDDEKPAREELIYILNKIDGIKLIGQASNGLEALELNDKLRPDIIFLDIQMPEISGMDVARKLKDKKHKPIIIFVTAYDNFAVEAFEVNALDYLLKPISEEILEKRLKKVLDKSEENNLIDYSKIGDLINELRSDKKSHLDIISLNQDDKLIPIEIENIIYATIEDKNTIIITKNKGQFESNLTLNRLLERLDSNMFFRSHKSYIVNLNDIASVEAWFNSTYNINLKSSDRVIPVSRSYVKEFREIMNIDS